MNRKIMPLLIMLIMSVGCLGLAFADNNTTGNVTAETIEDDLTDYIIPVHITDDGIEFSDGFTGFCLDSSKDVISANDKFTSQGTTGEELENHVKLAIIECYRTGHENDIQNVVSQVIAGNKDYDVVKSVYNSTENVDDTAVVNISNDTEATFTFELLKSADDAKSDCLAYKVSMKPIANDNVLGAANDEANDTLKNQTDNAANDTLAISENNDTPTEKQDINGTGNASGAAGEENNDTEKSTENNSTSGQTEINETNKTIINKTNTVIVNENNTTIINQKNVKTINKTNETPKNATLQNKIMRVVGNPIFLLVIVIVIVAVVAVAMRRRN